MPSSSDSDDETVMGRSFLIGLGTLAEGQRVSYEIENNRGKDSACNLKAL